MNTARIFNDKNKPITTKDKIPKVFDMRTPSSSEQIIRRLYQITNNYTAGFEFQINELIRMGLERFSLDIGILSRIEDNIYMVKHCLTPEGLSLKPGDQFDLDITYCSLTYAANGPVALEHIGKDDVLGKHPAYEAFGLESYIGIPIRLNGELYGTFNFSSAKPYPRKFHDTDIDALKLMASWIEVELVRREQEKHLNRLNKILEYQADHDSLTNIPNRRGALKALHKDLNRISRNKGQGIIAIIDIDHFKKINDTYGHQKGDEALESIAQKISDSIRDYDLVGRLGGEEFLLWLPDSGQLKCEAVCKRIMCNIEKISLFSMPLTVSIGAYHFDLGNHSTEDVSSLIDRFISKADKALYRAKDEGRNRVIIDHS